MLDLNKRSQMSFENVVKRGINLSVIGQLKKISEEVVELTAEYFNCEGESKTEEEKYYESLELADIIIACLTYSHMREIDIEKAIIDKMKINKEHTNQIRKSNQTMQGFNYRWDDCGEITMRYVDKKNAESAEQARKEADEKLTIAVKALKNIIDGNDLACERGESMASWMDSGFRRQAKDALKEIQG